MYVCVCVYIYIYIYMYYVDKMKFYFTTRGTYILDFVIKLY